MSKQMSDERFQSLLESTKEAAAISRGETKPARVTILEEPHALQVRNKLGLSRSQFSKVIGVSVRTIENWEQGRREPTGAAKSLLTVADKDPQAVLKALQ